MTLGIIALGTVYRYAVGPSFLIAMLSVIILSVIAAADVEYNSHPP
jgi:hypothetical protein